MVGERVATSAPAQSTPPTVIRAVEIPRGVPLATLTSAASPSAPPSCWDELSTADPSPALDSSVPANAATEQREPEPGGGEAVRG